MAKRNDGKTLTASIITALALTPEQVKTMLDNGFRLETPKPPPGPACRIIDAAARGYAKCYLEVGSTWVALNSGASVTPASVERLKAIHDALGKLLASGDLAPVKLAPKVAEPA